MQLHAEIAAGLQAWADQNDSVAALWLFGSRARDEARPDSDYDIALELMPRDGLHDWAFGNAVALDGEWKQELRKIVAGDVSLIVFRDDLMGRFDPRVGGVKIWAGKAEALV